MRARFVDGPLAGIMIDGGKPGYCILPLYGLPETFREIRRMVDNPLCLRLLRSDWDRWLPLYQKYLKEDIMMACVKYKLVDNQYWFIKFGG